MREANVRQGWPYGDQTFDGIFCRGSINCFWFPTAPAVREFLDALSGSLAEDGWLWIAPWNHPGNKDAAAVAAIRGATSDWAAQNGIRISRPHFWSRRRYGLGYDIPRIELWTRF